MRFSQAHRVALQQDGQPEASRAQYAQQHSQKRQQAKTRTHLAGFAIELLNRRLEPKPGDGFGSQGQRHQIMRVDQRRLKQEDAEEIRRACFVAQGVDPPKQ